MLLLLETFHCCNIQTKAWFPIVNFQKNYTNFLKFGTDFSQRTEISSRWRFFTAAMYKQKYGFVLLISKKIIPIFVQCGTEF